MALRLPYQVRKISESLGPAEPKVQFSSNWYYFLCEYMMTQQTPYVRRQVRKLLLYICGTKDKYRELGISTHFSVTVVIGHNINIPLPLSRR